MTVSQLNRRLPPVDYTNAKIIMTSTPSNLLLVQSARLGNLRQVATAIDRGAEVDATDAQGTTALMFAAQRGFTEIVDLLLARGADVNLHRRQFGTTALMFAAAANQVAVVRQLLEQQVDLNATNEDGSTALMGATLAGATEIVELLIAAGADVLAIDRDEDNALNIAIARNHSQIVGKLIAAGADIHYRRRDGKTPILTITDPGVKILNLLLAAGANPQDVDSEGDSLLLMAAEQGYVDLIKPLIQAGASLNLQNNDGWTPLIAATAAGNLDIVKTLLAAGADPNLCSQQQETALHLVAIAEGEGSTTEGDPNLVQLLLSHGAKTDTITSWGDTPLVLATLHGHTAAVAAILDTDLHLDAHQQGSTAFGLAIVNRYPQIAQLLLAKGCDPDLVLKNGQTPLMLSAIQGELELLRSLIAAQANLNNKDDTGATALMWATHRQQYTSIELLLRAGADRSCKNHGGLTALDLAEINRDRQAIDLLQQIG